MRYVLPTAMRDRRENRPSLPDDQGTVYWHVLFRSNADVQAVAKAVHPRTEGLPGLHLTPTTWLHMTLMIVGPAEEPLLSRLDPLLRLARTRLVPLPPTHATIGKILYHPEAVALGVEPTRSVRPLREQVEAATREIVAELPLENEETNNWAPHITIAYSTLAQPAEPIIAAIGHNVDEREVHVESVSLVVQWGAEQSWNWDIIGTIHLASRSTAAACWP